MQVVISIVFLALYTQAINSINPSGDLDVVESFLYLFVAGSLFDEAVKLYKAGKNYLGFTTIFNNTLYALLVTSFATRMVALAHPGGTDQRERLNILSCKLAPSANKCSANGC